MKELKITAYFTAVVLVLAVIYALVFTKHYRVIDSGVQAGWIYTIYQHRDGTKIGCYSPKDHPQEPSKCYNIQTKEVVPFPENDVE